jgi:hypothetical protein
MKVIENQQLEQENEALGNIDSIASQILNSRKISFLN